MVEKEHLRHTHSKAQRQASRRCIQVEKVEGTVQDWGVACGGTTQGMGWDGATGLQMEL